MPLPCDPQVLDIRHAQWKGLHRALQGLLPSRPKHCTAHFWLSQLVVQNRPEHWTATAPHPAAQETIRPPPQRQHPYWPSKATLNMSRRTALYCRAYAQQSSHHIPTLSLYTNTKDPHCCSTPTVLHALSPLRVAAQLVTHTCHVARSADHPALLAPDDQPMHGSDNIRPTLPPLPDNAMPGSAPLCSAAKGIPSHEDITKYTSLSCVHPRVYHVTKQGPLQCRP